MRRSLFHRKYNIPLWDDKDWLMASKIALITGSARGIGRAIALDLANQGADIVVNYRSRPDAAEEVADKIKGMGRQALVVEADVADYGQV